VDRRVPARGLLDGAADDRDTRSGDRLRRDFPGEVRIYRQLTSPDPDEQVIADVGMRNARLGGVQGLLQLTIVFVMVSIRLGA